MKTLREWLDSGIKVISLNGNIYTKWEVLQNCSRLVIGNLLFDIDESPIREEGNVVYYGDYENGYEHYFVFANIREILEFQTCVVNNIGERREITYRLAMERHPDCLSFYHPETGKLVFSLNISPEITGLDKSGTPTDNFFVYFDVVRNYVSAHDLAYVHGG